MTPGLARGPPFPPAATKNSIVAIASLERPSVPRVVGVCEIDVSSLEQVQGAKGHAVRGYHWDGDEIWAWGQSGKSGSDAPLLIEGWDTHGESGDLRSGLEDLSIADHDSDAEDGGVSVRTEAYEVSDEPTHSRPDHGVDGMLVQEADVKQTELSTKGIAHHPFFRRQP